MECDFFGGWIEFGERVVEPFRLFQGLVILGREERLGVGLTFMISF